MLKTKRHSQRWQQPAFSNLQPKPLEERIHACKPPALPHHSDPPIPRIKLRKHLSLERCIFRSMAASLCQPSFQNIFYMPSSGSPPPTELELESLGCPATVQLSGKTAHLPCLSFSRSLLFREEHPLSVPLHTFLCAPG